MADRDPQGTIMLQSSSMTALPMYIIDAFADEPLAGNPAAVCPLESWLPDTIMQAIAAEMNLSETVFFVANGDVFEIRWFTPTREVDMVGHATLAAGYLVLERLCADAKSARFVSNGVDMLVTREAEGFSLNMPALVPKTVPRPNGLDDILGRRPCAVLGAKHYLLVFDNPADVAGLTPNMAALAALDLPAVIVTAPGNRTGEFVSRFFAPANGVPEDPVSGVAHCCLTPYWSKRLGRSKLIGRQLSRRGGLVHCENCGDRVVLRGNAAVFLEGNIYTKSVNAPGRTHVEEVTGGHFRI